MPGLHLPPRIILDDMPPIPLEILAAERFERDAHPRDSESPTTAIST